MKIKLKERWVSGQPASEFRIGMRPSDTFSFTGEDGELYNGVMMSGDKGVLNIPGGIRFDALFENPTSLKGERREVTKEFMEVTIS
jgi:hypothetical protein